MTLHPGLLRAKMEKLVKEKNPQLLKSTRDYCAMFAMPRGDNVKCNDVLQADQVTCIGRHGGRQISRKHVCLCGERHPLMGCKKWWSRQ